MKAATERKVLRWIHIITGIPIIGYIYGPVAQMPQSAFAVKAAFFPVLVLSGLWLWKGYVFRNWVRRIFSRQGIRVQ